MMSDTKREAHIVKLKRAHVEEMFAHARETSPAECCGLIGGRDRIGLSLYRLRNVAPDPLVAYEASPRVLFLAQKFMRDNGQQLLGIYHSHPRAAEPSPSETDVRLAFYPEAVYFIIGFAANGEGVLRAFRIYEGEARWEAVEFDIVD